MRDRAEPARLRTESIGLYYLHRVDPETPLEESLGASGSRRARRDPPRRRLRGDVEQIEQARRVVPIAAVQNHYNLDERGTTTWPTTARARGSRSCRSSPAGTAAGVAAAAERLGVPESRSSSPGCCSAPRRAADSRHALDRPPAREPGGARARPRRRRRHRRLEPMNAAAIERMLEQHFHSASHAMYQEDAVLEFPQSGERFEGVENLRAWRSNYPASTSVEFQEIRGHGRSLGRRADDRLRRRPGELRGQHPRAARRQDRARDDLRGRGLGAARVARRVEGRAVGPQRQRETPSPPTGSCAGGPSAAIRSRAASTSAGSSPRSRS